MFSRVRLSNYSDYKDYSRKQCNRYNTFSGRTVLSRFVRTNKVSTIVVTMLVINNALIVPHLRLLMYAFPDISYIVITLVRANI